MSVGDRVLDARTRAEGLVVADLSDVGVEDDYGSFEETEAESVFVLWDGCQGVPVNSFRIHLWKIEGYRTMALPSKSSGVDDYSVTFASRDDAVKHRAKNLADREGERYIIVPVDRDGNRI